jgi:hypothetical protein
MKIRGVNWFYSIGWRGVAGEPGCGWIIQPSWRVAVGWWKYGDVVAGPFKTRREARDAKKKLDEQRWT